MDGERPAPLRRLRRVLPAWPSCRQRQKAEQAPQGRAVAAPPPLLPPPPPPARPPVDSHPLLSPCWQCLFRWALSDKPWRPNSSGLTDSGIAQVKSRRLYLWVKRGPEAQTRASGTFVFIIGTFPRSWTASSAWTSPEPPRPPRRSLCFWGGPQKALAVPIPSLASFNPRFTFFISFYSCDYVSWPCQSSQTRRTCCSDCPSGN